MKILYVTTIASTMSFFSDIFRNLTEKGHSVELACNTNYRVTDEIINRYTTHNISFSRSPFSADNLKAYRQLKKLVREKHYDIIHCHTPNAAAITRLACKGIRKNDTKVIYTAHGFHFYKGAPLKNWLVYYPVEWLCAHWTDVLITINKEDYALAKKKMKARKIEYVPGVGIDLSKFSYGLFTKEQLSDIRKELGIPNEKTWLLSVGELNDNKNHETVLRAIADIKDIYYTVAGRGRKLEELTALSTELGIADRVKFLGYRSDISLLCEAADIFVMPSFREGLSVALMEAMASGMPCCVSRIRGNTDLIDEKGGMLFDPHSVDECREAIRKLLASDKKKCGEYNRNKIKHFDSSVVENAVSKVYAGGYCTSIESCN